MSGVLAQQTGRQDILLRRGVTEDIGVRWQRSEDGGATFAPVDLSGWTGVFELRSLQGEVWLSRPVIGDTSGLAVATIATSDLTASAWLGRATGGWLMNMTAPDGRVQRLGDGNFALEG